MACCLPGLQNIIYCLAQLVEFTAFIYLRIKLPSLPRCASTLGDSWGRLAFEHECYTAASRLTSPVLKPGRSSQCLSTMPMQQCSSGVPVHPRAC